MDVGSAVLQGLVARSLSEAPELQEPAPLSPQEVSAYSRSLKAMSYGRLLQEVEVLENLYAQISPALPEYRSGLDLYPHPLVQRRLLALNEVYARTQADPVQAYTYRRSRMMFEWGAAGAAVGAVAGYMTGSSPWWLGTIGAIVGGVAGRSDLLQNTLTTVMSRVLMTTMM